MREHHGLKTPTFWMAIPAIFLLSIPLAALIFATSASTLWSALEHPLVAPALWLSLKTSVISLGIVVALGLPLAWWLARSSGPRVLLMESLIDLPIVLPPAVIGIALLLAFGPSGALGGAMATLGISLPFSSAAVVLAQVVVSAPFFIKAATDAFRALDFDLLLVARTLGHGARSRFFKVALPIALPGLITGASLAWARSLGEFGATLIFAGNLPELTQTMPLAIYSALEAEVEVAQALALILATLAISLLIALKLLPRLAKGLAWWRH